MEGTRANLTGWDPQKDLIVRVCVSSAVGCGPWSQPLVVSSHDHAGKTCKTCKGKGAGDGGFQGQPTLMGGGWQCLLSEEAQRLRVKHLRPRLYLLLLPLPSS